MALQIQTYRDGKLLPVLPGKIFSHSTDLFHIYEKTSGYEPVLMVASENQQPIAQVLAVIRRKFHLFPPYILKYCEIYDCGEFHSETYSKEDLFEQLLKHLTEKILPGVFYIKFRNIVTPLFGYKFFRQNEYFPVGGVRVYNSLHSKAPVDRLEPIRKKQIKKAIQKGVTYRPAETQEEKQEFLHFMKTNYSTQTRKHFPYHRFFESLVNYSFPKEAIKTFIVEYKEKIIGGSLCVFSNGTAYLWFLGGMKKAHPFLHPKAMAVWAAISYAKEKGFDHFEFLDAGLPFDRFSYREFILSFGGKQTSTRQWYRFRWNWLNRFLCRIYV